jgi:hypothetical protein
MRSKPLHRFLMVLPALALFVKCSNWHWYYSIPIALAMIASAWWLLFDGFYNLIRNYKWWFTGGHQDPTEPDDSRLDIFLFKLSVTQQAILKIGGVILFISIYLITLLKK